MVVAPADPDATGKFTVAPTDLMDELAAVRLETSGAEVFGSFTPEAFPYRLVSRRLKAVLNSLGVELSALRKKEGTTNHAHMNPDDMHDLALTDDDLIRITSPAGSIVGVVAASPDVRRGVISMAHSWGGLSMTDEKVRDIGVPTSRLVSTDGGFDPVTGMVVSSAIPVNVARFYESDFNSPKLAGTSSV